MGLKLHHIQFRPQTRKRKVSRDTILVTDSQTESQLKPKRQYLIIPELSKIDVALSVISQPRCKPSRRFIKHDRYQMFSTYCSPLETVLTIMISIIKVVLTSDYDNDNNKNVLTV